jgi:hypothetical protein
MRSVILAFVAAGLIGCSVPRAMAADAPAPATTGRLASLAWLAGSWGHDSAGVRVEEHWMAPAGSLMLGMARSVAGGRVRSFEFLRIREWGDSLAYIASPGGRPPTPFPVKELGDRQVVFENLAHDFPQRISYQLGADGQPQDVDATRTAIANALSAARSTDADGPVFHFVEGLPTAHLDRSRAELFREQVGYSQELRERLAQARTLTEGGLEALRALEAELGDVSDVEVGVVIDLFLSYRAIEAWKDMIRLKNLMSRPLQESVMVQEQFALALNRDGRGEDAELVLLQLVSRRGPSSETFGILGRVYKDRWRAAKQAGNTTLARELLDEAIDAYLSGFEADWRDAYPGINALALMELRDPSDDRIGEILPVVKYSVTRRFKMTRRDGAHRAGAANKLPDRQGKFIPADLSFIAIVIDARNKMI